LKLNLNLILDEKDDDWWLEKEDEIEIDLNLNLDRKDLKMKKDRRIQMWHELDDDVHKK